MAIEHSIRSFVLKFTPVHFVLFTNSYKAVCRFWNTVLSVPDSWLELIRMSHFSSCAVSTGATTSRQSRATSEAKVLFMALDGLVG